MSKFILGVFVFIFLNTMSFAGGDLTVKVYNSSGYPAKRVSVKGYYGGGMNEHPTKTVKTDSSGKAVLSWDSSHNRLSSIYISGQAYKDYYYSGKTYTFNVR